MKKVSRIGGFLSLFAILSGCAEQPPVVRTVVIDPGCKVFRQITWEPADTPPTVAQIRRHNAAFMKLCRSK